ncbi:hypothetical protein UFOVP45_65 [uncultured Caudovirales phage]|uniref:Uncharacterized protein n=1 Tax=uncultured Caudovirales phage TaxID=2100421 RepID=A0A6J5KNG2_9CAUD|nr:hypothetical protein UFOVP45_65 [uncultured Caudovirales phage]
MSNADWWAARLGNQAPQTQQAPARQLNLPPMPPSQQPMPVMPSFQQTTTPDKAQSAKQTATCPDCGSTNFMAVSGAKPRCFDCGYPIEQQGSRFGSTAGAHVEGTARAATGNDTTNNWNPQGIIGRIDG